MIEFILTYWIYAACFLAIPIYQGIRSLIRSKFESFQARCVRQAQNSMYEVADRAAQRQYLEIGTYRLTYGDWLKLLAGRMEIANEQPWSKP